MEQTLVMEEAWDYLVILDACRYDFFEEVYGEFLEGALEKRCSAGSSTVDWRDRSFGERYQGVVYVSSNPYINSLMPIKGYLGTDHFDRIYDVWSSSWDEARGTVLPESVTAAALSAIRDNPGKRVVIHYLQPHAPYLSLDMDSAGFPVPELSCERVLTGVEAPGEKGLRVTLLRFLSKICHKTGVLGENPTWLLRQWLRMAPASPMDAVRREHGVEGLRSAYRENLRLVLKEVQRLLGSVSGRIVVTSDHGELLGEGGRYSHCGGSDNPYLTSIPWLVIEKEGPGHLTGSDSGEESSSSAPGGVDEAKIRARLKALGYID